MRSVDWYDAANHQVAKHHIVGYTRWRVDFTDKLKSGARNVIAIRCHNLRDS